MYLVDVVVRQLVSQSTMQELSVPVAGSHQLGQTLDGTGHVHRPFSASPFAPLWPETAPHGRKRRVKSTAVELLLYLRSIECIIIGYN